MYWLPIEKAQPPEFDWKELVRALDMTGIKAERLYGGLWHFTMTLSGQHQGGSFLATEPWDKDKGRVNYQEARRLGRRLTRMFG